MDIALDKVCELILRAKAVDVKEGVTDPDSGSNPVDDGSTDVLIDGGDDLDMEPEEWRDAVRLARERDAGDTADYLLGIPNLGDLLDEGLAALGRSCT
jgi:hypothetical protein